MSRRERFKKKRTFADLLPSNKGYLITLLAMAVVALGFMTMMCVVDAFPLGMTMTFVIVLLGLIVLVDFLFKRDKKWLRIVGIVIAAFYIIIYGLGIYYLSTTYTMFARISTEDTEAQALAKKVSVTEEPFNVYITGIDQWDNEKGLDLERSDVNMIVTVNPETRTILLTSIPRDTYVALHRTGDMDKLTHTGIYGVDETLNTVEDWLGIDLNYYLKMNFTAARKVINAMDGIDVYSPVAFSSSISEYSYVKGWNHLMGKQALYFARERHAFEGKDSIRVENQQRVVKACMQKMLSSSTLLTRYGAVMGAAGNSLETNMSQDEMQALVKMQLADLSGWDIETQKVEGKYDMDKVASLTQDQEFLVYKAKDASVQNCINGIEKIMKPSAAEKAEAAAKRQTNSMKSFIKSIFQKEEN